MFEKAFAVARVFLGSKHPIPQPGRRQKAAASINATKVKGKRCRILLMFSMIRLPRGLWRPSERSRNSLHATTAGVGANLTRFSGYADEAA
jgi:hypothetical protein